MFGSNAHPPFPIPPFSLAPTLASLRRSGLSTFATHPWMVTALPVGACESLCDFIRNEVLQITSLGSLLTSKMVHILSPKVDVLLDLVSRAPVLCSSTLDLDEDGALSRICEGRLFMPEGEMLAVRYMARDFGDKKLADQVHDIHLALLLMCASPDVLGCCCCVSDLAGWAISAIRRCTLGR